jgi:hypothetical protein
MSGDCLIAAMHYAPLRQSMQAMGGEKEDYAQLFPS